MGNDKVSKPAVSPISKSAGRGSGGRIGLVDGQRVWQPRYSRLGSLRYVVTAMRKVAPSCRTSQNPCHYPHLFAGGAPVSDPASCWLPRHRAGSVPGAPGAFWSAPVSGAATCSNPPAFEKLKAPRNACVAADGTSAGLPRPASAMEPQRRFHHSAQGWQACEPTLGQGPIVLINSEKS